MTTTSTRVNKGPKTKQDRAKKMPPDLASLERFTTGQAAAICDVAPRTVSKWADSGQLKCYRIPGSLDRRILRSDLIAFMEKGGLPLGVLDAGPFRVLHVGTSAAYRDRLTTDFRGSDLYDHRFVETVVAAAGAMAAGNPAHAVVIDFSVGTANARDLADHLRGRHGPKLVLIGLAGDDFRGQVPALDAMLLPHEVPAVVEKLRAAAAKGGR